MKKLLILAFTALMGLALVVPAMADSASGDNQSSLTTSGSPVKKQNKKKHYKPAKKQHKKKSDTPTTTQQ